MAAEVTPDHLGNVPGVPSSRQSVNSEQMEDVDHLADLPVSMDANVSSVSRVRSSRLSAFLGSQHLQSSSAHHQRNTNMRTSGISGFGRARSSGAVKKAITNFQLTVNENAAGGSSSFKPSPNINKQTLKHWWYYWFSGVHHEIVMCVCIVVDFLLLLWRYHMPAQIDESHEGMHILGVSLLILFGFEALLQVTVHGGFVKMWRTRRYVESLDLPIILVSVALVSAYGLQSRGAMIPRGFRIIRIALLGEFTDGLQRCYVLCQTMAQSAAAVASGFGIFITNLLLFSIVAMEILPKAMEDRMEPDVIQVWGADRFRTCTHAFSSLSQSMSTLFALSIGDRWNEVGYPMAALLPWSFWFFLTYTLIAMVMIAGSMYAALSETHQAYGKIIFDVATQAEKNMKVFQHRRLLSIFERMAQGCNHVTFQTFYHRWHSREFHDLFRNAGIPDAGEADAELVWDMLDKDGDGVLTPEKWIDFFTSSLAPSRTRWQIARTNHEAEKTCIGVETIKKGRQRDFADIHEKFATQEAVVEQLAHSIDRLLDQNARVPSSGAEDQSSEIPEVSPSLTEMTMNPEPSANLSGSHSLNPIGKTTSSDETVGSRITMDHMLSDRPNTMVSQTSTSGSGPPSSVQRARTLNTQLASLRTEVPAPLTRASFVASAPSATIPDRHQAKTLSQGSAGIRSARNSILSRADSQTSNLPGVAEDDEIQVGSLFSVDFESLVATHMRGVTADSVAQFSNPETVDFWGTGSFGESTFDHSFKMSNQVATCDYFVSHCWNEPREYFKYFQRSKLFDSYAYRKAVELNNILNSQTAGNFENRSLSDYVLWIDKCCIPQHDKEVKAICVNLLEHFLSRCNGMVVLLSWHYFTRLWCVYEWACFLRMHHPASVEIGCDAFLKVNADETLPLFLQSIEALAVKNTECYFPEDHGVLEAKVFEYYKGKTHEESFKSFERFAKCTAICFFAKQVAIWRAHKSPEDENVWFQPVRDSARRLGYKEIVDVIDSIQPHSTFVKCGRQDTIYVATIKSWFENVCCAFLIRQRQKSVRSKYLKDEDRDMSSKNSGCDSGLTL